jgi:hypothetical protein
MDSLIEVSPDQHYGPTTLGAVRSAQMGKPTPRLTNRGRYRPALRGSPGPPQADSDEIRPVRTSMFESQQRIRELEEALMEERRARDG